MKKIKAVGISFVAIMAVIGFVSIFLLAFRTPVEGRKKEVLVTYNSGYGNYKIFFPDGKIEKFTTNDPGDLIRDINSYSEKGWEVKAELGDQLGAIKQLILERDVQ